MTLRITRGKERSLRISLPFPAITTVTPAVCWRTVRPGGMPIASRMAKICDRGCCAATATYNMMAKNTAASLIGQLRTISCPRLARTVIDQPPDQNFVHGTVPLRRADYFLDDHPVAIDHPPFGHACRVKHGCCGAHPQQIDLRTDLERERRAEHQRHHDADRDRPLPRCRHTVTRQRRRRSRTSRAGSPLVKIAWPATNVSAPAAWAVATV